MPGPYSKDLRRRVVAAVLERGERPEAVARRFEVGRCKATCESPVMATP